MLGDQITSFISYLQSDPSLLGELGNDDANLIELAAKAGFQITESDVMEHQDALRELIEESLSPEALDGVAGGLSSACASGTKYGLMC